MNLENGIMSPVDKSSCSIMYIIGIFCFVYAILALVMGIYFIFNVMNLKIKDKGLVMANVGFNVLTIVLLHFLAYYLYRIQYTICLKVL